MNIQIECDSTIAAELKANLNLLRKKDCGTPHPHDVYLLWMDCNERMINILYVDDDIEDFWLFRDQMQEAGFAKVAFFSPESKSSEVVDYLDKNKEELPDAILVDALLPMIDGVEILRTIRSHPEYRRIPVIIISGSNSFLEYIRNKHSDIDAEGYLSKPIDPGELSDALKPFSTCINE